MNNSIVTCERGTSSLDELTGAIASVTVLFYYGVEDRKLNVF